MRWSRVVVTTSAPFSASTWWRVVPGRKRPSLSISATILPSRPLQQGVLAVLQALDADAVAAGEAQNSRGQEIIRVGAAGIGNHIDARKTCLFDGFRQHRHRRRQRVRHGEMPLQQDIMHMDRAGGQKGLQTGRVTPKKRRKLGSGFDGVGDFLGIGINRSRRDIRRQHQAVPV